MAKFPDGTILMYKANARELTVEVTTKELIFCKNCKYCKNEEIWVKTSDGCRKIEGLFPVCDTGSVRHTTSEDGYCHMAQHRSDDDGR